MRESLGKFMVLAGAAFGAAVTFGAGVSSAPAFVTVDPNASIIWKTVTEWPLEVQLDWPEGAVKAVVTVTDAKGGSLGTFVQTDTTKTSLAIDGLAPQTDAAETVAALSLSYLGSDDAVLGTESAHLGFVRGIGDAGTLAVTRPVGSRQWKRLTDPRVCELPKGATGLAVDGVPVEGLSSPDWFVADVSDGLTRTFTLVTPEGECEVPVEYWPGGMSLLLR